MAMRRYEVIKYFFCRYLKKSNSILDVGCGVGEYLKYAIGNNRTVVGVDLDKFQIKNKICDFIAVQCDASYLPFTSESFDLILFSEVLEHLPFPARALEEISRVLKPGGVLLVSTPSKNSIYEKQYLVFLVQFAIRILQKLLGRKVQDNVGHISLQSPQDIKKMLKEKKFKVLSEHYRGFCIPFTGELLNFFFRFKLVVKMYLSIDTYINKKKSLAGLNWSMIFLCQKCLN